MTSTRRIAALLATLAAAGTAGLAACSGSDDATGTTPTASATASVVGGTAVCGTVSMDAPDARPDDAQVPADIWVAACNTN